MTLDTRVAIGGPVDHLEVYTFVRELVATPGHIEPHQGDAYTGEGLRRIGNPMGIGLCALIDVTYNPAGGPFPLHVHDQWCHTQDDVDEHNAWVATDPRENGWAHVEVSFDTTYGYRGESGETCSDLHARLVAALGQWLDARSLPWKWKNEYTGEWFDRFDQLDQFGSAHRAIGADAWFRTVALPAITLDAAARGATAEVPR